MSNKVSKVTVDKKMGTITIVMPLIAGGKGRESKEGKNILLASSGGIEETEFEYAGKLLKVGANVMIENDGYKPSKKK